MKTRSFLMVAALAAGGLFGRLAIAQQSSGSISGVVQDSQGAVIPGATVTLLNQAQGGVARQLHTTGEGYFFFTPVIPGTYTVSVEATGFKKYVNTDVKLYAQDRVGLPPIVLELGSVGESINVEAPAVSLQTVSAERSGVLSGRQMTDLGSSTRLYTDLLPTIPG